ncbi:hypothetical protein AB8O38_06010 [Saccharomonospora xinjiangensis]|uniref:hypothetical protein n=1 Tax=Saccharomonospora xinjiangensis TaxID=75294 RepID=UPI0035100C8C
MKRRTALLLVLAVLLAGAGAVCVVLERSLRSSESARDDAHVDADTTLEVRAAVVKAVNKVFTYHYDDLETTERAAQDLLRGQAREEYHMLFSRITGSAEEQRLTVTTRVVDAAVLSMTGDRAEVLVFADQTSVRDAPGSSAEPASAAAQLLVTATRHGDRWLLTALTQT